ncbi:hypothetical protein GOODEAATRI_017031 [Goodea atripinnis]|uniref:Uncharacterized protein n=1 Tax=Goodea atripinnis TaxID=208336 RepID=A0ABV0N247_9TELE
MVGSLSSISAPQASCGYNVVYYCQCVNVCLNGWMTDCSLESFEVLGLDKALYKCRHLPCCHSHLFMSRPLFLSFMSDQVNMSDRHVCLMLISKISAMFIFNN